MNSPDVDGLTFRQWIDEAKRAEDKWIRTLWCQQQGLLANHLDWTLLRPYLLEKSIFEMPVLVVHDQAYPTKIKVGTLLGCKIGPSVVEVVAMPTRKRLRLAVVEGPEAHRKVFEWKRDLLLPFWVEDRQRRLF